MKYKKQVTQIFVQPKFTLKILPASRPLLQDDSLKQVACRNCERVTVCKVWLFCLHYRDPENIEEKYSECATKWYHYANFVFFLSKQISPEGENSAHKIYPKLPIFLVQVTSFLFVFFVLHTVACFTV